MRVGNGSAGRNVKDNGGALGNYSGAGQPAGRCRKMDVYFFHFDAHFHGRGGKGAAADSCTIRADFNRGRGVAVRAGAPFCEHAVAIYQRSA